MCRKLRVHIQSTDTMGQQIAYILTVVSLLLLYPDHQCQRGAGCGMRDGGMRDAGCGMRDAGCGMRDAGCVMRDADTVCVIRRLSVCTCMPNREFSSSWNRARDLWSKVQYAIHYSKSRHPLWEEE